MPLFRTAGDISGFQSSKPEWAALFILGRGIHVTCSLRFASGATPADLLEASIKMIYYYKDNYRREGIRVAKILKNGRWAGKWVHLEVYRNSLTL